MKDEDVITLAKKCNAMELGGSFVFDLSDLHAFSKAVQDKQRQEDAKICEVVQSESSKVLGADIEYKTGREMAACICALNIRNSNKE